MTVTLEDFLTEHPVDRTLVDSHKQQMLAEVRAYKLRELREAPKSAQLGVIWRPWGEGSR